MRLVDGLTFELELFLAGPPKRRPRQFRRVGNARRL